MRAMIMGVAAVATLGLWALPGLAQQPEPGSQDDLVHVLDRNGNGCIDLEEGRNYSTRRFHAMDTNADDQLDATEAPLTRGESEIDRPISADAWQRSYGDRFSAVDTDKNGCLSREEVAAARAANAAGGQ